MPYEGEFAKYLSVKRITESPRVKDLLGKWELTQRDEKVEPPKLISCSSLTPSSWLPEWVIAIDGSHLEVPMRNGYPSAEASYITVASVMLNIKKMIELDSHRPVDPKEFHKIEQPDSIDSAFPGCNVVYKGQVSAQSSLRLALFETLKTVRMSEDGETLLDTYEALLKYKPATERQNCPVDDCQKDDRLFDRKPGQYVCACKLARPLYSTDALRIHEGMIPFAGNGAMFAEIMQVLERLWIVHVLRTMEAKNWLSSLQRLAFFLDGPLAVFGHPAWLSQAIYQELSRINAVCKKVNGGQDLLILGVIKTGIFVDHFAALDRTEAGSPGHFPKQSVCLLSDSYIKQNIIFSTSQKPYGRDTYFGREFFYKTKSGALLTANLPFLSEDHRDGTKAEPEQYPRLRDALNVLDHLISVRYPNAVTPLISAHAEASIPLGIGTKILERLAKDLVHQS